MSVLAAHAKSWLVAAPILACLSGLSPDAQAQSTAITYRLDDVWLRPDISHSPSTPAQQMTGTFVWTYDVGAFENGSAAFLDLYIPWGGTAMGPLKITAEPKSIEFVLQGNYHDLGVDVTLAMAPKLAPGQSSPIDLAKSKFDVQKGVSWQGHFISGSIVPACPLPQNYGTASAGSGNFVPTIASSGGAPQIDNASFQIECDHLLGGASTFFLIGFAKAKLPASGVDILVDPANLIVFPLVATGTAGVADDGALIIPLPIPNNSLAVGIEVDFQLLVLDSGSPKGVFAATDGLTMEICSK